MRQLSVLGFQTNVEARISVRPIEFIKLGKALERRRTEHDLQQLLNERLLLASSRSRRDCR